MGRQVEVYVDPDATALKVANVSQQIIWLSGTADVVIATGNIEVPYIPVRGVTRTQDGKLVLEL